MQYGRGTFSNHELNYLPRQESHPLALPHFKVGFPIWSEDAWKGNFYTADCSKAKYLNQLSLRLDCTEVSSTFYSPLSASTVAKWREQTDSNFKFLPKWPQTITHDQLLYDCQDEVKAFISSVQAFEDKLGVTMLQLPPGFDHRFKRNLFHFIEALPQELPVAIEFRHPCWFQNGQIEARLKDYLEQRNISSVITDTPAHRECFHLDFTGEKNIIRYLSDENLNHDETRLRNWNQYLHEQDKPEQNFFIIHSPDNIQNPVMLSYLAPGMTKKIEELNQPTQGRLV